MTTQPKVRTLTPEREAELPRSWGWMPLASRTNSPRYCAAPPAQINGTDFPYLVVGNRRLYDLRRAAEKLQQVARITRLAR